MEAQLEMKFAICDDNITVCESIKEHILSRFADDKLPKPECAVYNRGSELAEAEDTYDIVFLDVEIPDMDGISVCKRMSTRHSHTLFVMITSYSEYIDDAFRIKAFRFLTKPIDWDRFYQCLSDAMYASSTYNRRLAITHKDGISTVYLSDIVLVESANRKVYVKTVSSGTFISTNTMSYWFDELGDSRGFYSPHHSYIINFEHIVRIDNVKNIAYMDSGDHVYISRRRAKEFKNSYLLYMKSVT